MKLKVMVTDPEWRPEIPEGKYEWKDPYKPYAKNEWYPMWEMAQLDALENLVDRYKDQIIIMQSTGLKDRNGKEIFEGDLVRWFDNSPPVVVEWGHASCNCCDAVYGFGTKKNNYLYGKSAPEVVGNIYESPSLLPTES
jgi:uncharacterized phage protein (TIGR01671 family)